MFEQENMVEHGYSYLTDCACEVNDGMCQCATGKNVCTVTSGPTGSVTTEGAVKYHTISHHTASEATKPSLQI